jgi:hypothetical protein
MNHITMNSQTSGNQPYLLNRTTVDMSLRRANLRPDNLQNIIGYNACGDILYKGQTPSAVKPVVKASNYNYLNFK